MKERPILFSGEMVKAILEGRKTQTRRVITPQPKDGLKVRYNPDNGYVLYGPEYLRSFVKCPYGVVGDRLYVRETFCIESNFNIEPESIYPPPYNDGRPVKRVVDHPLDGDYWEQAHYKATDPAPELSIAGLEEPGVRWSPSIHMPRWASRITLEIIGVRVERVQDISPDDCLAEGINYADCDPHNAHQYWRQEAYAKYGELWNKINEDRGYGWGVNPWVWVVEFKAVQQ